ncbi:MAG: RagB/SusD family nutrient uptake outer membrane protein [Gemmatimonadaceae bacterium]
MTQITLISRLARTSVRATAALACGALAACGSLLEIDNPNNVTSEALTNPAAAPTIINGAENSTVRALQSVYTPYAAITDETIFKGSRDDYQQLDQGQAGNPANEYTNQAAFNVNEARWLADNAIKLLEGFDAENTLADKDLLYRAYLNKGVIYSVIADMYDDFTISDRTIAGDAIGEANMFKMYDDAIAALDKGVTGAAGDLKARLLAVRARVKHGKAVWGKLNPVPSHPTNPLVADNGFVADAQAALAAGFTTYDVLVTAVNVGNPPFGFELNNRVEITTGPFFVTLLPNNKPNEVTIRDIIETNKQEPFATENIAMVNVATCHPGCSFGGDPNLPPLRVASAAELQLLIAEAALAAGNNTGFDAAINALRATKGLAPYTGAGPSRTELLQFERRVALLFMGRRLNDMYRFGVVDPNWNVNSTAVKQPGCLFPIGISERESNPFLAGGHYQPVCR